MLRTGSRSGWGLSLAAGLLLSSMAAADPWAPPGDMILRHDVQLLADAGVILVGIDTPSVDPYPDEMLEAHRAAGDANIATRATLGSVRRRELEAAAAELGVDDVVIHDRGDGTLAGQPEDELLAIALHETGHLAEPGVAAFQPPEPRHGHERLHRVGKAAQRSAQHLGHPLAVPGVPEKVAPLFDDRRRERVEEPPPGQHHAGFERIGWPGEYPYTRSLHPGGYRSRAWTTRQYTGFGTPEETNERFRYLIANGQTGRIPRIAASSTGACGTYVGGCHA